MLLKEKLDYPSAHEELEILNRIENDVFMKCDPVLSLNDIMFLPNFPDTASVITFAAVVFARPGTDSSKIWLFVIKVTY